MTIGSIAARYAPQRFDGPLTAGGEARDYSFDCAADLPAGATVTSASVAIAPSGTLECSILQVSLSGSKLTAEIESGQPRVYTAKWSFTISSQDAPLIYITEIACNPQLPGQTATAPDSPDFGTPKTAP